MQTSTIRALALALAATLVCACATRPLPPAEPAGVTTGEVIRRVQQLYLYPDRIDRRMMAGALDGLEARFDPVRFDDRGDHGVLWVGSRSARVPLESQVEPGRFSQTLGQALAFVRAGLDPEELEDANLETIALEGALGALDRYSTVFTGRETEDFQIRFSGKLSGIGARIGRRDGYLTAVRVFPESPAQKGGLVDGDTIIAIEGDPTRPLSVEEAVERIRGPAGSRVALTVLREDAPRKLEIVRGEVTVPTVETEALVERIGYAHVLQVSKSTPDEFSERVKALGDLDGLVLDLRGNAGGSMLASASFVDFFLSSDVIFQVAGREGVGSGVRNRMDATPEVLFPYPVAMLVDDTTASAAEIIAGALAPLPRATLIGQKTFGKGVIQRVMDLTEGTLLKLTVGEYLLSAGRAIHLRGIEPDVELFPISTERPGPLGNPPANALVYLRKPGEDDRFPIEVARAIAASGRYSGLRAVREQAEAGIRAHLAEQGIDWSDPPLPELLPEAPRVRGEALELASGQTRRLRVRVDNPNPFPIPGAWLALQSPTTYVADRLVPLGTLPPVGSGVAEIDMPLPDGFSAPELSVLAHVAAGRRTLQSQRLVLHVQTHRPEIEVSVALRPEDQATVTVRNRSAHATGEMRVDLPGVTRVLDRLEAGEERSLELPVSEHPKSLGLTLFGPNAQRRFEIPLRDAETVSVPPDLELHRKSLLGRQTLEVRAHAAAGLREGWIAIDGEKQTYERWDGGQNGALDVKPEAGDLAVRTRVETSDGVAMIDTRIVTAE
jgi:carboxyl-terminal processing protease